MLNRDQLAALARGTVTVLLGAALLYAIGRWLGWYALGAVVISGIGGAVWDAVRCPWRWW